MKLKTGDKVVVISGSNKGKEGTIVEVEAPIHASNVMLLDPKTKKPTRVKIERDEKGKKIRISKKSNQKID